MRLACFVDHRSAKDIACISAHAMDGPLAHAGELWLSTVDDPGVLLGFFQRASELEARPAPVFRRSSGGPAIFVGSGSVHLALALANPAALTPCDAPRLVNRYVRPLLRALSTTGEKAAYFGRDWISVQHRPAAWIGFAHDGATKRSVVEAVIGVGTGFALDRKYPSFIGKSAITLEEAAGRSLAQDDVIGAIEKAYADAYGGERASAPALAREPLEVVDEPPWRATIDEVIGIVGAGRDRSGKLCVGGELLASRDAIDRLEAEISRLEPDASPDAVGALVDRSLASKGVAVHGLKSLKSVRDVIAAALAN